MSMQTIPGSNGDTIAKGEGCCASVFMGDLSRSFVRTLEIQSRHTFLKTERPARHGKANQRRREQ